MCVCPWSAPGCAAQSSSGFSPTPSSSSPPPSAKTQLSQASPAGQNSAMLYGYKEKQCITSWYFLECQPFHRFQCSSSWGSRCGAERTELRPKARTARSSFMMVSCCRNKTPASGSEKHGYSSQCSACFVLITVTNVETGNKAVMRIPDTGVISRPSGPNMGQQPAAAAGSSSQQNADCVQRIAELPTAPSPFSCSYERKRGPIPTTNPVCFCRAESRDQLLGG